MSERVPERATSVQVDPAILAAVDRSSTGPSPGGRGPAKRQKGPMFTQRGVALILVVTALIMIGLIAGEWGADTAVDEFGTVDARDQMQAEYLARSSLNLSELILRLQQVLDSPQIQQMLGNVQITDYASMFMSAFGGTDQEVADQGLSGDVAKGYGAEVGYFDVKISTDDGKINLNCANGKPEYALLTYTLINSLYYFPAFDPLFQDPDADGWRRDRRLQTQAIVDYIDTDQMQASGPGEPKSGGAEDYGYENLRDRYKPKNNYLDSVDEAKLIRGVDDRFWTLFGPSFTVYGGCKLNVRALEDPRIISAILYLTAKDPNDPVLRDGARLWYNALAVSWARKNGYSFGSTDDFVNFVKDPQGQLAQTMAGAGSGSGSGATRAPQQAAFQIPGIPQGVQLGLELDPASVKKVLRGGPQRTYRVEAIGVTSRNQIFNEVHRQLTAVWDMGNTNSNQRSTDTKAQNGSWVYLHEE